MKTGNSPDSRRRILVVDDHPLTRRGIAELIRHQPDLTVCCEAGTAAEALEAVRRGSPDMVLTDFSLPDKHGLEFIKDLLSVFPDTLVLVVSMHDEKLYAERVLRAGARGYIMKNEGGEKLLEAIRQVFGGRTYVSPSMSSRILEAFSGRRQQARESAVSVLTDREFEVFQLVGQGMTTQEISRQLRLSPKTIETHRLHIRQKLNVESGPELIKQAVRWAGAQELI